LIRAVGFERGSPERIGSFLGTGPFKHGREAPFANEALENRVHQARSWQEPGASTYMSKSAVLQACLPLVQSSPLMSLIESDITVSHRHDAQPVHQSTRYTSRQVHCPTSNSASRPTIGQTSGSRSYTPQNQSTSLQTPLTTPTLTSSLKTFKHFHTLLDAARYSCALTPPPSSSLSSATQTNRHAKSTRWRRFCATTTDANGLRSSALGGQPCTSSPPHPPLTWDRQTCTYNLLRFLSTCICGTSQYYIWGSLCCTRSCA
jgi:hypothetical protein